MRQIPKSTAGALDSMVEVFGNLGPDDKIQIISTDHWEPLFEVTTIRGGTMLEAFPDCRNCPRLGEPIGGAERTVDAHFEWNCPARSRRSLEVNAATGFRTAKAAARRHPGFFMI